MKQTFPTVPGISDALRKTGVPLSAVVRHGDLVFVSGIPPIDPVSGRVEILPIDRQTELVIENVRACLEAAGTSLDKILKTTLLVSNAAYYEIVNDVYRKYFPDPAPARSFCTVGSWPWPFDIEMECIAYV
jgi:2-iminobutanoate/2-iminopropanoate deaminase